MIVCGKHCEIRRGSGGYYLYSLDDHGSFVHPTLDLEQIAIEHDWKGAEGGIFPWIKDEESILAFIDFLGGDEDVSYWDKRIEKTAGKEIWEKVKNGASRKMTGKDI